MRAIDADKIVYSWQIDADGQEHDGVTLQSIIDKMPTIELQRKTGHWINIRAGNIADCDQCGVRGRAWMNYCPVCGSDNREETAKYETD